jgi:hypothetical protein
MASFEDIPLLKLIDNYGDNGNKVGISGHEIGAKLR